MSGIIGSKNHRGSGLIADLGTDGQILTSAGAGLRQVFEAAAGGGGNYYWFQHSYSTNSGSQNIVKTGFGFAPVAGITFNFLSTLDTQSFGMAYKPVHGGTNGSPTYGGASWHNVGNSAQVDQSHGSDYFARFPRSGAQDFDYQIYEWGSDGVTIGNIQSGGSTANTAKSYMMFFG